MILIVGLGNPGKEFQKTRHNLGFMVLDYLKKKWKFEWEKKEKLKSKIAFFKIEQEEIILAKPQTFMNNSGKAVKLILEKYKIPPENLLVFHDDLDIPLGKLKFSFKRGAGGHKGIESIINEIKTKNFFRVRLGIKTAEKKNKKDFVLGKISKEEERILKKIMEKIEIAIFVSKDKLENLGNLLK
jgi:PTH1 family peptidyl-tRNA hydrolase